MNNKEIILSDAFDYGKIIGKIENNIIEEASGLVESVENSNSLWTHNDGGDGPFLYLISSFDAKKLKGTYVRLPSQDEIPFAVLMNPAAVVEYYSR